MLRHYFSPVLDILHFLIIQFKASGKHQPKALRIEKFNFRANSISGLFQFVTCAKQFVDTWNRQIDPYLTKTNGIYLLPISSSNMPENTPETSQTKTR